MKRESQKIKLGGMVGLITFGMVLFISDPTQLPRSFITEAEAIIGRPLTPFSFAGMGRRMARRSIYAAGAMGAAAATDAAVSGAAYATTTYVDQTVSQPPQSAPAQQELLPVGSVLPSLPSGCDSSTVDGHSYFTCAGNWYKPAMQNGNIVYTVVSDPKA